MEGPPLLLEDKAFPSMDDACLLMLPLRASDNEDVTAACAAAEEDDDEEEEPPIEVERASCAASAAETLRKRWLLGDF